MKYIWYPLLVPALIAHKVRTWLHILAAARLAKSCAKVEAAKPAQRKYESHLLGSKGPAN